MPKLPVVSGGEVVRALKRVGFIITRQKGSHVCLHKKISERTIFAVVPMRDRIKKGTLLSILKQALLEREEFIQALKD